MTDTAGIPGDRIRSFIERVEHIDDEIKALNEGKKEVFTEAKGEGFDVKVLREILRLRKQDKDERDEQEIPARPVSQSHGERRVITGKGGVAPSRDELLVVLTAPGGFADDPRFKAIESGCTGWNRPRLLIQPQPTSSCQLSIRLSTRGHAPTTRSSPAECPEHTLT